MANLLFDSLQRLRDFPLDPSAIHKYKYWKDENGEPNGNPKEETLQYYLESNPIAHPGQVVVVYGDTPENNGVSVISEKKSFSDLIEIPNIVVTNKLSQSFSELDTTFKNFKDIDFKAATDAILKNAGDITTINGELDTKVSNTVFEARSKTVDDSLKLITDDLKDKASNEEHTALMGRVSKVEEDTSTITDSLKNYVTNDELSESLKIFSDANIDTIVKDLNDIIIKVNAFMKENSTTFDAILKTSKVFTDNNASIEGQFVSIRDRLGTLESFAESHKNIVSDITIITNRLDKADGRLDIIERDYATKEYFTDYIEDNINPRLAKLEEDITKIDEFKNMEQVMLVPIKIDSNNSSEMFKKETVISEIRLVIDNPSVEDIPSKIVLLENGDEITLVNNDEILLTEKTEFIYEITKKIDHDDTFIKFYCDDFNEFSGNIFVKYSVLK